MNIRYECKIEDGTLHFGKESEPASLIVAVKHVIQLGVTNYPDDADPYAWEMIFKNGTGLGVPAHAIDEASMMGMFTQHVAEEDVRAALDQATEATERFDCILWTHPKYQ